MGCGTSVEPQHKTGSTPETQKKNNNVKSISDQNGMIPTQNGHQGDRKKKKNAQNTQSQQSLPPPKPVPRAVAFDVQLDNNIDKILSRSPPKRLKRLEPLENMPKLSAEMLEEKLKLAEEKRQRQLDKKRLASRKSASKKRQALQRAQEFEKTQQMQQADELDEKLRSAGKNREAKQRELEEKKRVREERAQRARERAQQLKQQENGLEFDVEKDDNFNADDDDSWLDGDNNRTSAPSERIYSGRESPHKQAGRPLNEFRGFSASTTDSHDYAFQRQPQEPTHTNDGFFDKDAKNDDFFDS